MPTRETPLSRLIRERGHLLTDPVAFARAREAALATDLGMPDVSVRPEDLSADALLVIAQWKGRPDAALDMIHDVCVPAGRIADRSMIPAVGEVREAGLTENAWEGLRLMDAGRAVLAALESGPGGVPGGPLEPAGEPGE